MKSVGALQAPEVISWRTFRQAIGISRRDIERVQDPQPVFQINDAGGQCFRDVRRQVAPRASKAMPPALLTMVKVQSLQGFFHRLVGCETSPFMVPSVRAEAGLGQISLGLMQPVRRTIHLTILLR